eukprot:1056978-Prorocentrum_lima.AAC.1
MHGSREETLLKLKKEVWWPSMSRDVRRWAGSCAVCKLPNRSATCEQKPARSFSTDPFRFWRSTRLTR